MESATAAELACSFVYAAVHWCFLLTLCGLQLLIICWLCLAVLGFITLTMPSKDYKL